MNNRGMEVFLAIAMAKNFQKAAELLNLTQSTVSHRLQELEDEMGSVLIKRQRGHKEVALTVAGDKLLPLALRWRQLCEEMDNARKQTSVGKVLTIGGLDSVKNHILLPFFKELRKRCPALQIKFATGSSTDMYDLIARRGADVGFVQFDTRTTFVNVIPFCREELFMISAKTDGYAKTVDAKTLNPADERMINWGFNYNRWHERIWGVTHPAGTVCDTLFEMRGLMKLPRAWAMVPASAVDWFLKDDYFTMSKVFPAPPMRVISILTNQEPRLEAAPALAIFTEILNTKSIQHEISPRVNFIKLE